MFANALTTPFEKQLENESLIFNDIKTIFEANSGEGDLYGDFFGTSVIDGAKNAALQIMQKINLSQFDGNQELTYNASIDLKSAILDVAYEYPFFNIMDFLRNQYINLITNTDLLIILDVTENNIPKAWIAAIVRELRNKIAINSANTISAMTKNFLTSEATAYLKDFNLEVANLKNLTNYLENPNFRQVTYNLFNPNTLLNIYLDASQTSFDQALLDKMKQDGKQISREIEHFVNLNSFSEQFNKYASSMRQDLQGAIRLEIFDLIKNDLKESEKNPFSFEQMKNLTANPEANFNIYDFYKKDQLDAVMTKYNLEPTDFSILNLQFTPDPNGLSGIVNNLQIGLKLKGASIFTLIYERNNFEVKYLGDFWSKLKELIEELNLISNGPTLTETDLVGPGKVFENVNSLYEWIKSKRPIDVTKFIDSLDSNIHLPGRWPELEELMRNKDITEEPDFKIFMRINDRLEILYYIEVYTSTDDQTPQFQIDVKGHQNFKTKLAEIYDNLSSSFVYKNNLILILSSFMGVNNFQNVPEWVINKITNWDSLKTSALIFNSLGRFEYEFHFITTNDATAPNTIELVITDTIYGKSETITLDNKDFIDFKAELANIFDLLNNYKIKAGSRLWDANNGAIFSFSEVYGSLIHKTDGSLFSNDFFQPAWMYEFKVLIIDGKKYLEITNKYQYDNFNSLTPMQLNFNENKRIPFITEQLTRDEVDAGIQKIKDKQNEMLSQTDDANLKQKINNIANSYINLINQKFTNDNLTKEQLNLLVNTAIASLEKLLEIIFDQDDLALIADIEKAYGGPIPQDVLYWIYGNLDLIKSWLDNGATMEDVIKIIKNKDILNYIDENELAWDKIVKYFLEVEQNYKYGFFGIGVGLAIVGLGSGGGAMIVMNTNKRNKQIQNVQGNENFKMRLSKKIPMIMSGIALSAIAGSTVSMLWFFIEKGGF